MENDRKYISIWRDVFNHIEKQLWESHKEFSIYTIEKRANKNLKKVTRMKICCMHWSESYPLCMCSTCNESKAMKKPSGIKMKRKEIQSAETHIEMCENLDIAMVALLYVR